MFIRLLGIGLSRKWKTLSRPIPDVQPRRIGRTAIDGLWKDLFSLVLIVLRSVCHGRGQAFRVLLDAGTQTNPFIHDVNQHNARLFSGETGFKGRPGRSWRVHNGWAIGMVETDGIEPTT